VFFRKYTKNKADSLGLVGWVENAQNGNVIGTVNLVYLKF
jgi:acylphosphatase